MAPVPSSLNPFPPGPPQNPELSLLTALPPTQTPCPPGGGLVSDPLLHLTEPQPADLSRLNAIHIAGTKGKGSTSALASSILNAHRLSLGTPSKVGLYTSPHLTSVRERIRLNEAPISEALFARYFSEVWDALAGGEKPGYFRLLTLLSFHVFMQEGVDAAVYEVGVGGAFDATNVLAGIAAAGVLDLGIDHVGTLGPTLAEIAWHKAGVIKAGAPAFTVPQEAGAMAVLRRRADEVGAELVEVGVHPGLRAVRVRPDEEFQRRNASMAIQLSAAALRRLGVDLDVGGELPGEVVRGIETVNWRGRCETLAARGKMWHLDGAHTEESLEVACRWFGRVSKEKCALRAPPPKNKNPPFSLFFSLSRGLISAGTRRAR